MPSVQYYSQVMVTSAWWLECAKSRELSVLLINAHPGYLTNGIFPMSHGEAVVAMVINEPWFYGAISPQVSLGFRQ